MRSGRQDQSAWARVSSYRRMRRCPNTSNSPLGLGSHAAARSLPDSSIKCSNTRMPPGLEQRRGLLRERFGFAAHREKLDLAGYAPVVGHNGPKMKQSAESEMEAPESSGPTRLDENLFPVIPPGYPPKRDSHLQERRHPLKHRRTSRINGYISGRIVALLKATPWSPGRS